jgi:hypothetical protein
MLVGGHVRYFCEAFSLRYSFSSSSIMSLSPQQYFAAWAPPSIAFHKYHAIRAVFSSKVVIAHPWNLFHPVFCAD